MGNNTLSNKEIDPDNDNLLDLAGFYCEAAVERTPADPELASAYAQIAISVGINRLVDLLDRVIYDRGDGEYFVRIENTK
jgi:hypothetical protein